MSASEPMLLAATGVAIVALVGLIVRARWHPFIALASVSVVLGIVAGLPPAGARRAFQGGPGAPGGAGRGFPGGLGAPVGLTAGVIALGAMLGKLLALSGGAESLTARIIA